MSEHGHSSVNAGEIAAYPPPPPPPPIGDTLVNVDWHQLLTSGFPPAVRAVTVEERAAAQTHLRALLDDLAGAAHLGPFEAEEEAAGAFQVALFRYCQARGFSLWAAFDRTLTEMAIAEGLRFLGAVPR